MVTFTTTLSCFTDNPLWSFHIPVSAGQAAPFLEGDRRVVCHIGDFHTMQAALMPDGNGGWFIMVNKTIRTKFKLAQGQELHITLEKDNSKYGLPMPEELQEMLEQDPEADAYFHALTPGKQRSLIYWCSNVKSSAKKVIRSLVMTKHLKILGGKVDFKLMNQMLKEENSNF